jgi:aminoglycoside-2''-adenylyltransferase
MNAFDPLQILQVLDQHKVKFVVIGGIAGRLWGSTTVTNDLDICYARDRENLEALAGALKELKVKLRGADRDLPFIVDARSLKMGDSFTFTTIAGNLDTLGTPAGSGGYEALARTATKMDVGGVTVLVASLEDLIRMKRAAGRPKDLIEVEVLAAVREEIEGR